MPRRLFLKVRSSDLLLSCGSVLPPCVLAAVALAALRAAASAPLCRRTRPRRGRPPHQHESLISYVSHTSGWRRGSQSLPPRRRHHRLPRCVCIAVSAAQARESFVSSAADDRARRIHANDQNEAIPSLCRSSSSTGSFDRYLPSEERPLCSCGNDVGPLDRS